MGHPTVSFSPFGKCGSVITSSMKMEVPAITATFRHVASSGVARRRVGSSLATRPFPLLWGVQHISPPPYLRVASILYWGGEEQQTQCQPQVEKALITPLLRVTCLTRAILVIDSQSLFSKVQKVHISRIIRFLN